MDKRHKQKLGRDLERYRALLKLSTDQRALAALKQLIEETTDRLNDISNSEQRVPLMNTRGVEMITNPETNGDKIALERV
jgi:hypothetical protein